jgi:hypothetical protein
MEKETILKNPKRRTGKGPKAMLLTLILAVAAAGGLGTLWHFTVGRTGQTLAKKTIYTCVMHHQIRREEPGDCPICGMKLVPLEQIEGGLGTPSPLTGQPASPSLEKRIKYWANPMDPAQHSNKPMKDDMGMDFIPVYEQEGTPTVEGIPKALKGLAPIQISPYKQQLIGVRFATAEKVPITRVIRTNGRFAGGAGDFAALAGDFAASNPLRASGRYVVADVYALDIPFVRVGQKAIVTTLSGSGASVEGKVAQIYPYDETQSRVTRVRINLAQAPPQELFANVDIQATTEPRLAVPPTAVMDTGNHRYVFLQGDAGTFIPKEVTIGYEGSDLWEVTAGLKEGDKVVDGANFLIDADSKLKTAFTDGN